MTPTPHDDGPSPDPRSPEGPAGQEPAEDEYSLQAEESLPESDAWYKAIQRRIDARRQLDQAIDAMQAAEEAVRFSVRDLLLLTTFAASLLALFRVVRPDVYALTLGVLAFISLVGLSLFRPKNSILIIGWWVLLAVYLISAVAVTVRA
ncbi:MAG: hypothetical protein OES79_05560 [Planctomycetota bacterium]|nr:hypothetical protein [Planctomycetota bacterium]